MPRRARQQSLRAVSLTSLRTASLLVIAWHPHLLKAAATLKKHIVMRCREKRGERHGMAEMDVGTIHAFGLKRLKNEGPTHTRT